MKSQGSRAQVARIMDACGSPRDDKSRRWRWDSPRWILGILFALLIFGCVSKKWVSVESVPRDKDVPAQQLVEYVEQMRYLAMREEPTKRDLRLKRLDAIDLKIKQARTLMEEYRMDFGFRECGSMKESK